MSDVLSQDEVDALLQGVADGSVPSAGEAPAAEAAAGPSGVRGIDLTSQERSLWGRLPGLELLLDRFGRSLRGSLGTFFGQLPNVTVSTLELIKYATFAARLSRPVCLQLFKLTPLRGQGLLVIPPPIVGALLQVFFGGDPAKATPVGDRDFSAIEQRVLERLGTRVLHDLREAWRPVEPIEFAFVRSETNPSFATIAAAQDLVMLIEVRIEIEGCVDGCLSVCIPNAALETVRPRLQALHAGGSDDTVGANAAWRASLRASLAAAEVEVSAELGRRAMAMRDVLNFKAGDLITLGTGREGPVLLRVAGRPAFLGAPGVLGGNNAVRVQGPC